jgi:hypothetical protein
MTRDEAILQMRRASSWRTICEVHRDIYDLCSDRPEIQELVIEAFILGKKMDAKLREYKADWDKGELTLNEDHRADSKRRKCA